MSSLTPEALSIADEKGALQSFLNTYRLPETAGNVDLRQLLRVRDPAGRIYGSVAYTLLAMENQNIVALAITVAKVHPREKQMNKKLADELLQNRMQRFLASIVGKQFDTKSWHSALRLVAIPRDDCCEAIPGAVNLMKIKSNHAFLRSLVSSIALDGARQLLSRKENLLH